MRLASFLLAYLFTTLGAFAQPFQKASVQTHPIHAGVFKFSEGARTCRIADDGAAVCRRAGRRSWTFRLPTSGGTIEDVYFIGYESGLLLAYELTDGERGWASVVRVNRGATRIAWRLNVNGLNMAAPVLHARNVFVAALGFLARVELEKGSPVWRVEQAYDGAGYEIPEISVRGTSIVVRSIDGSARKTKIECFEIETGAIQSCGS